MPLKLTPPRQGKTPNYQCRGTYLGISVERTTGTADKRAAQQILNGWKRAIERGEYRDPKTDDAPAIVEKTETTFAEAALAYLKANGDPSFISAIIEHTGEHAIRHLPLSQIDQGKIDNLAAALYPAGTAPTRNRQVYTPISAVMKRAGNTMTIKRPIGWRGSKATSWLEPEQAFAVLAEAFKIDPEFGLLCLTYCYTGRRLSELLRKDVTLRQLKLDRATLYIPDTKNGDPISVHLPPIVVQAFREQPARRRRPTTGARGLPGRSQIDAGAPFLDRAPDAKLFRFHVGGHLRKLLAQAMMAAGLSFPKRQGGFHLFCHTYGTWMTQFGGLDTWGLVRTKRWKDPDSADRYSHTFASPEARRADLLPTPKTRGKSGEKVRPLKKA